jgi:nitric oxide reductase activation protein
VHSRLIPSRRDVAVAFALDLSASTAVRLPPRPDHEPERILDLERDAVALVAAALQHIGDAYAIYGFSGAGRDNVAVSVVKELRERFSAATLRRLASLVPDHTTRMAPAIRHITEQLDRYDARTRILVVVSDGRPFDIDYGHAYGERALLPYAVADTAKALAEARRRGVRPYLITVDPAGNDYLGAMCEEREYNVITDARDLPESLAQLYLVARDDARTSPPSYSGASST